MATLGPTLLATLLTSIIYLAKVSKLNQDELYARAPPQRLASGPGHPIGGGPSGGDPLRARLGPDVHEDGRGAVQHRGEGEELCCGLPRGHHRGARLQQDVRAVRPVHGDVLLPQQAHHDRPRHRQQQQDQLAAGGQAGDGGHPGDRVPRRAQGPRSRRLP